MITLYTALKLTGLFDRPDDIVYMQQKEGPMPDIDRIMSVRSVKEKFDLRAVKVTRIAPYFCCNEYEGMMFTIREGQKSENKTGNHKQHKGKDGNAAL